MKVFFHHQPSPAIRHWQSLAKCVGIACENAEVGSVGLLGSVMREVTAQKKAAVALDIGSLKNCCNQEQLAELADYLAKFEVAVLLLASALDEPANLVLQALTHGAIRGIKSASRASRVTFPKDSAAFSEELTSHSFAREPEENLSLDIAPAAKAEMIMLLDQAPAFVRVQVGKASIFVWATNEIFDMLRPLAAEKEFELAADKYVPSIIFLRFAFGDQCWRNPSPGAGIVIDDPLLRKNYGFINFPKLLESARRHRYHVTLAFIPWNHWRSRVAKARMFLDHADCFSVCAHGCDHTNKEFGSTNYDDLLSRNFVARQRMEQHHERTGLACEPLMVCPQEQYSLEAMRAFADSRQFIGVVCTACMPRNLTAPAICGADLLLPAQDSFCGFPVFKRHYWSDISVFAMALFLGKPAILVEHHEFFRAGPGGAEAFVSGLSQVHPRIQWTSLAETVKRTHLRRRLSDGRHEVRFFTDDFKFEHQAETPANYRLVRRIPETTHVRRVMINGTPTLFNREKDLFAAEIRADRPQTFQVQVEVAPIKPAKERLAGIRYQASVAVRRGLSEFRDNVIARNDFVLRAAKLLAKKMKQTSI
jgi:hypothetical protein